jgi:hypothetical protein
MLFHLIGLKAHIPDLSLEGLPAPMSTATTTEPQTAPRTTYRSTTHPTANPATHTSPNAAQRLRATMAAVKLFFTWLGVRKTLPWTSDHRPSGV